MEEWGAQHRAAFTEHSYEVDLLFDWTLNEEN